MAVRKLAALAAGVVLSAFVTQPASATLIYGSFSGTIYDSADQHDAFGAGLGNDTVNGQGVTGTFSYIFEQVPPNSVICSSPGFGCYRDQNGPDWLTIGVTINGVTFSVAPAPAPFLTHSQTIISYDRSVAGYDYFGLDEYALTTTYDPTLTDVHYEGLGVWFVDHLTEVVPGDAVPSANFSWTDDDISDEGYGYLSLQDSHLDPATGMWLSKNTNAFWSLKSLSIRVVEVPEPASVALFGAGLLGLSLMNRRRRADSKRRIRAVPAHCSSHFPQPSTPAC